MFKAIQIHALVTINALTAAHVSPEVMAPTSVCVNQPLMDQTAKVIQRKEITLKREI